MLRAVPLKIGEFRSWSWMFPISSWMFPISTLIVSLNAAKIGLPLVFRRDHGDPYPFLPEFFVFSPLTLGFPPDANLFPETTMSIRTKGHELLAEKGGQGMCLKQTIMGMTWGLGAVWCSAANEMLQKVGEWGTGLYYDVVVEAHHAICAADGAGVDIVDLSNLSAMRIVANVPTTGYVRQIAVNNRIVFAAGGYDGLMIIDITEPNQPRMLSTIDPGNPVESVTVANGTAYLGGRDAELFLIDVSDPASPVHLSTVTTGDDVEDMVIADDRVFLAVGDAGLEILDVRDLHSPFIATAVDTPKKAECLLLLDHLALVGDGWGGILTFDLSDPNHPNQLGQTGSIGNIVGLAPSGSQLIAVDNNLGMRVFDVSDPAHLEEISRFTTPSRHPEAVFLADDLAYVADYSGGLAAVNIADRQNMTLVGCLDQSGTMPQVWAAGDHLFFCQYRSAVRTLDTRDPSQLQVLGSCHDVRSTADIAVQDDRVYLAIQSKGVDIYDSTEPGNLRFVARIPGKDYVRCLAIRGTQLFCGDTSSFYMTDIRDPQSPVRHQECTIPDTYPAKIALSGDRAVIAASGGVSTVDISDPENPLLMGSADIGHYGRDVAVLGHHAFLVASSLYVVDISDPFSPTEVHMIPYGRGDASGICIYDQYAVVAAGTRVQVYDIADPTNPVLLTEVGGLRDASMVSAAGRHIYVTDSSAGKLHAFEIEPSFPHTDMLAHVTSTEPWNSFLVIDNAGARFCYGVLSLFDEEQGISKLDIAVPPGLNQVIPLKDGSCGRVSYCGENVSMKESFVNNSQAGIAEFVLDGASDTTLDFLMPAYQAEKLTWMGLALCNPHDIDANVTMTAFDPQGSTLGTSSQAIKAHHRTVGLVDSFFPDLDFRSLARIHVSCDQPVCGITISGVENEKLLFTKAVGPNLNPRAEIAHIATAWDTWNNFLVLDNLGDQAITATMTLFSGGTPVVHQAIDVPGQGNHTLSLDTFADLNPDSGFVELDNSRLAVRQSFESVAQGGTAEFMLNHSARSTGIVFNFPTYQSANLNWMGLALFNSSPESSNIALTAYRDAQCVDETTITLIGQSRQAHLLSNLFPSTYADGIDRVIATSHTPLRGIYISGQDQLRLLFSPAQPMEAPDHASPPMQYWPAPHRSLPQPGEG